MTEREQVIANLLFMKRDCLEGSDTDQTIDRAVKLLKEQEPIAPKLIKMYPHDIYECGNCGHRSVGSKDYKAKYCPECGRTLKWA